jgi:hypothetical protein
MERELKTTAAGVAQQLNETDPAAIGQIVRIVECLGAKAVRAFLRETLEIEAQGGIMLSDGSRRRTPGGAFFYLVKGRISRRDRAAIWPHLAGPAGQKKQKAEPPSWEECLDLVSEATTEKGEATTVKITLIGRPGRIVEKSDLVLTTMQGTKPPTLPKGLPAPPAEPTTYLVYIARKQWVKVAEAIQAPDDRLIVEGYPVFERRLGAMVVLTTNVTTKNLQAPRSGGQAAKREQSAPASVAP